MHKAIRFRAAVALMFGMIGLLSALTSVYLLRVDKNHDGIGAMIFLTLLALFFALGHMSVLMVLIRKRRKGKSSGS